MKDSRLFVAGGLAVALAGVWLMMTAPVGQSASYTAPITGGTGGSATNAQPPSSTLSNIANSGFLLPFIALSTNGGSVNNVTQLVARTSSLVVSNDSPGIASLHVSAGSGSQTPLTGDVNGAGYGITNLGRVSLTSTNPGLLFLEATNGTGVVATGTHKDLGTKQTNIVGRVDASSASVVEIDFTKGNEFNVTNRITGATSLVGTNHNDAPMSINVLGNASTSYTLTLVAPLGYLVQNLNDYSAALATSASETLTNGNAVEINVEVRRLNGTNVIGYVSRQSKF